MSGDLETFFRSPKSLVWQLDNFIDPKMTYRLLDAPFAREWIGVFRSIAGYQPLTMDWDWSASWQTNVSLGALPSSALLLISRLASAIFFPFDLILLFLIGRKLSGDRLGWLMMLFFALNSLVLLHTRRAMSEGPLVFFIIFTLWIFFQDTKFLYLAAIPVALAFNSKYSALPLFFLGILAIIIRNWQPLRPYKRIILHTIIYLLIFLTITYILNPFLWKYPIDSLSAAYLARKELLARQVVELGNITPGWIMDSPVKRIFAVIANLFISPLAYHDVGNYFKDTLIAEINYSQFPGNVLLRGFLGGGILFLLTVIGLVLGVMECLKSNWTRIQFLLILITGTILEFLFLIAAFSLPFQRYVLPLVPFVIIWIAYSFDRLLVSIEEIKNRAA